MGQRFPDMDMDWRSEQAEWIDKAFQSGCREPDWLSEWNEQLIMAWIIPRGNIWVKVEADRIQIHDLWEYPSNTPCQWLALPDYPGQPSWPPPSGVHWIDYPPPGPSGRQGITEFEQRVETIMAGCGVPLRFPRRENPENYAWSPVKNSILRG